MKEQPKSDSIFGILANSSSIYAVLLGSSGEILDQNQAFRALWESHMEDLFEFSQNILHTSKSSLTINHPLGDQFVFQIERHSTFLSCIGLKVQSKKPNHLEANQQEKLRAILDNTVDSHLLIDLNRKVVAYNKVAQEEFSAYYNQSIEEGKTIDEILPSTNLEHFNKEYPKVISGKPSIIEINRTINGHKRWFSIAYSPVFNEVEQVIGISKTTRDITQLRETEHKLQKQEEILDAIYQSTRESCTFIDNDLKIQYINQKGQELIYEYFGKNASVGDSIMEFVLPTYRNIYQNHYRNALSGHSISFEINDKNRWWEFELFPVYNQAKEIIGIAQNLQIITERKQKELETVRQNEFLKRINWQFSHEIRRPVASILGLCDLLKNHTSNSEEVKQFIDGILESSSELDEIIHKIVHLANAEDLSQN